MKSTLLILLAVATMAADKCGKNKTGDATPLISLETGPCFGFCPVFKLEVLNNGLVHYNGKRFVEKTGLDSFQLTEAEIKQLKTRVKEANLWQYPDMIKTDIMDAPFSTLIVHEKGKSKTVRGSIDRPAPLLELENLIKDLAEAHDFIVKRGVNPNAPPAGASKEVIVKLRSDQNAGNWITKFTELKLRLVRRISVENTWLVAYDPKQIDEKTLIETLKNSEGVIEVQTNKPVNERN